MTFLKQITNLLSPHQPWIFITGIALILIISLISIIFLTPLKNSLLSSRPTRRIRIATVIILCTYSVLVFLYLLFVNAVIVLFGGSMEHLLRILILIVVLIATIWILISWVRGSRFASLVILMTIALSTFYLINYRIVSICEPLALAGFSRAQLCMGELGRLPPGSHKKLSRSHYSTKDWYEKSAANGNPKAAYLMGVKNNDRKLLLSAVEHGELRAVIPLYNLTPGDAKAEIIYWLEKAAEQEMADAMGQLGKNYIQGYGVEKDIPKGVELIERAAIAGYIPSMWFMAIGHAKGNLEFSKNNDLSKKWELLALEREQELIKYEEELRKTYNFEVRPDIQRMQFDKLTAQYELKKAR